MMKKRHKFIFSLLFLLGLGSNQSIANHIVCTEMRYTCTGTPGEYIVGIKLYRDCTGIEFCANCPTSLSSSCKVNVSIKGFDSAFLDVNYGNADLTVVKNVSAYDVVQLCKLAKSICSNCGSRTPGTYTPGVEVYYFEGKVNLNSIPAACCKVRIGFSHCCRGNAISTIVTPNSTNYYSDIMINRCANGCNSSPIFTNDPVFVVCVGQDVNNSMGAIDPDGDSLSYEKGPMLQNRNTPVIYQSPYSALVPFPYLGAPIQSPPALPPVGIDISSNGDIRYRPQGTFVTNMPIIVKQWQKINGKMELVGEVTRDISIQTVFCPANNPPVLRTYDSVGILTIPQPDYSFDLNIGKPLCLIISAWDNTSGSDTTDISWNSMSELFKAGAKITYLYDTLNRGVTGPKKDSIQFCWTPSIGAVRAEPYLLRLVSSDRACPVKVSATRYLSFKVNGSTLINEPINNNNSFDVYPNPAKDQLIIELGKGSNEKLFIELISKEGKQMVTQQLSPMETNLKLKLNGIPAGVYFLRVNGANFQEAKKVVITD